MTKPQMRQRQCIRIPKEEIDNGARTAIENLLRDTFGLSTPDSEPDFWQWKTTRGTFPKRLAKWLKSHGLKPENDFLGTIGSMAGLSVTETDTYTFDFDDYLDWQAGDFGDEGSCFWSCNAAAREMLRRNGAFALRFYDDDGYGIARSWVAPYYDGSFVVFNGYNHNSGGYRDFHAAPSHGLTTLAQARILSHILGGTYKKVELENRGQINGTLWINSGCGYVVGSIDAVADTPKCVDLDYPELRTTTCRDCGRAIEDDEDTFSYDGYTYCERCYDERYGYCEACCETYRHEDLTYTHGGTYCDYCRDSRFFLCDGCDEWTRNDERHTQDDLDYCEECFEERYGLCTCCDEYHSFEDLQTNDEGELICPDCARDAEASDDEQEAVLCAS
ncbi:MAG: hypothetical protein ACYC63_11000 [Armatimonadota bacterium]